MCEESNKIVKSLVESNAKEIVAGTLIIKKRNVVITNIRLLNNIMNINGRKL